MIFHFACVPRYRDHRLRSSHRVSVRLRAFFFVLSNRTVIVIVVFASIFNNNILLFGMHILLNFSTCWRCCASALLLQ